MEKVNRPCLECEVCSRIVVDDDGTEDTPELETRWTCEDVPMIAGVPTHWQCPHCKAWNKYN